MINLREILSKLYADKSLQALEERLTQCGLLQPLKKTIGQLNAVISNQKELIASMKVLPVSHIAANILYLVNQCIAGQEDPDTKAELENLLSDICMGVLKQFFAQLQCPMGPLYQQVGYALQDICTFHNYDFHQLLAFLKLDTHDAYQRSLRNAEQFKPAKPTPVYYWKGTPGNKQNFLRMFKEQKLVMSIKGLAALFDGADRPLELTFDPAKADILLQLFYTLKKGGWLSAPKVWGFYEVLAYHTPDFERLFLHDKPQKRRMNTLKESKQKWAENQARIDKWLAPLASPQPGLHTGHTKPTGANRQETVSV